MRCHLDLGQMCVTTRLSTCQPVIVIIPPVMNIKKSPCNIMSRLSACHCHNTPRDNFKKSPCKLCLVIILCLSDCHCHNAPMINFKKSPCKLCLVIISCLSDCHCHNVPMINIKKYLVNFVLK